jgi:hypothetical protein
VNVGGLSDNYQGKDENWISLGTVPLLTTDNMSTKSLLDRGRTELG